MLKEKWASPEDFATLFQYFWYRDFPISREGTIGARRVDWTKHIDKVVGDVASLMGLVTRFERRRFDAVLRSADGDEVAIEWEWGGNWDKELKKLYEPRKLQNKEKEGLKYAVLIIYTDNIENSCKKVMEKWKDARWPLLFIQIISGKVSKRILSSGRKFSDIRMYRFDKNKPEELLRTAPAFPWEVSGTRWSYEIK